MHSCRHVLTGLSHSHRSPHTVPCHIAARRPADDAERAAIGYRTSIISSLLNYFYAPLNDGFHSFTPSPVAPLHLGPSKRDDSLFRFLCSNASRSTGRSADGTDKAALPPIGISQSSGCCPPAAGLSSRMPSCPPPSRSPLLRRMCQSLPSSCHG